VKEVSMSIEIKVEGDAAARIEAEARRLNIPVDQLVTKALANGLFIVAETSAGNTLILEDKYRTQRRYEPR
jgi:hypothetical protein